MNAETINEVLMMRATVVHEIGNLECELGQKRRELRVLGNALTLLEEQEAFERDVIRGSITVHSPPSGEYEDPENPAYVDFGDEELREY